MNWKQIEEFREGILLQEIIHLVETDLAHAAILCFGAYHFHQFADVLESALKANVVILGVNPAATIKQHLDYRQQTGVLMARSRQDYIASQTVCWGRHGTPVPCPAGKGRLRETPVRIEEMVDLAVGQKSQQPLVIKNGRVVARLVPFIEFIFYRAGADWSRGP